MMWGRGSTHKHVQAPVIPQTKAPYNYSETHERPRKHTHTHTHTDAHWETDTHRHIHAARTQTQTHTHTHTPVNISDVNNSVITKSTAPKTCINHVGLTDSVATLAQTVARWQTGLKQISVQIHNWSTACVSRARSTHTRTHARTRTYTQWLSQGIIE